MQSKRFFSSTLSPPPHSQQKIFRYAFTFGLYRYAGSYYDKRIIHSIRTTCSVPLYSLSLSTDFSDCARLHLAIYRSGTMRVNNTHATAR